MYPPQPQPQPMYPSTNQMVANAPVGAMHAGPNSHSSNLNVVVNQPTSQGAGLPRVPRWMIKGRDWNAPFCGCFNDLGVCCGVMFCTFWYVHYLSYKMDETCCMPFLVPHALCALRLKLRASENIEGTIIHDCCAVYLCPLCVMCQIENELGAVMKVHNTALQAHFGG